MRLGLNMTSSRRQFLKTALVGAALAWVSARVQAQSYPVRPVRIVVGFPAGGSFDIVARLAAQRLSERLGQQFIVENRTGAGGNVGTEAVVKAPADGYTLLLVNDSHAMNTTLYERLSFNFINDIRPIASIARVPNVMEVNPSVPAHSVSEFIAFAKAHAGKINMASGGVGTPSHVSGELFKMMTGVELVHVPYRGGAPALADLIAGQVQVMFSNLPQTIEFIRANKLRPLAVTTPLNALPGLPTVGETVTGYETSGWIGLGAPRNTPLEIILRLNKEINEALADPKFVARLSDLAISPLAGSPSEFGKLIADETEKWAKVIRAAGIKAE
jgi:tripartite-type tricarboxylate transporter receptor subunit TctC